MADPVLLARFLPFLPLGGVCSGAGFDEGVEGRNNTDAWRADHAGEVERNMTDLIAASRRRWGTEVRWVVGMPSDDAPYAGTVREQLERLAERDPLVTVFDTAGYGTQPDGLHFDAASVVRLGDDFYAGWKGQ